MCNRKLYLKATKTHFIEELETEYSSFFRKYPCRETGPPDSLFPCYNKVERLESHFGGGGTGSVVFVFEFLSLWTSLAKVWWIQSLLTFL